MSSETSTKKVRLKPDTTTAAGSVRRQADGGLQPWQFFVLAALGCATAVTFMSRDQGPTAVVLLGVLMATAAFVGWGALRALQPLVSTDEDRTAMVGQRTRVALEREKLLTLRSIKELEFDRAMGRLSDEDWAEMSGRLRARAARLMRQLDAGAGYRGQIERDLAERIRDQDDARLKGSRSGHAAQGSGKADDRAALDDRSATGDDPGASADGRSASLSGEREADPVCAGCATANERDAKFCKNCGQPLAVAGR